MTTIGTLEANGWTVGYEQFGTGREVVLLLPGALGTGRSDFREQLEGPNAFSLTKYTFVAMDLCGWGRSRPPERMFDIKVYERDADCAIKVMESLGHKTYSVIGWSDGAKVALYVAYMSPIRVKCVVALAVLVNISGTALQPMLFTRDMNGWPKDHYQRLLEVYGDKETIRLLWDKNINFIKDAINGYYGDRKWIILPEQMKMIRCPVLLVHGDKDPLISVEQPMIAKQYIPDSVLHRCVDGSHNLHQVFTHQFKTIVENFFENCDCSF